MSAKKLQREYDPEFRTQAVKLALSGARSATAVAKDLGIPVGTLHTWIHKYKAGALAASDGTTQSDLTPSPKPSPERAKLPSPSQRQHDRLNDLEERNRELEIKLRRMTMERDVLKKAMAYCLDVPK